jgi:hypothetical protein
LLGVWIVEASFEKKLDSSMDWGIPVPLNCQIIPVSAEVGPYIELINLIHIRVMNVFA